ETVVYVVDAGPCVPQKVFQECRLWVEQQMVQKLLFNHRDDVAVVAFGCKETNNSLEEEEGYENIAVVVPHRVVDPSSLQAVHAMEQAAEPSIRSDWLSALVVSLDLLIRAKGPLGITKGVKRVVLLTGGGTPLEEASEGSNEEQVATVAGKMHEYGISLHAVLLSGRVEGEEAEAGGAEDYGDPGGGRAEARDVANENEKLLRRFFDAGACRDHGGRREEQEKLKEEDGGGYGKRCKREENGTGDARAEGGGGADEEEEEKGVWSGGVVCGGELRVVASLAAAGMLYRVKPRVLPTTSYRGDLLVAPGFTIKDKGSSSSSRFRVRNPNWWPERDVVPEQVFKSAQADLSFLLKTVRPRRGHNLTKSAREAIRSLSLNRNIVIKPADKNVGITVMDRSHYVALCMEHLTDADVYLPVRHDPILNVLRQLSELKATITVEVRLFSPPPSLLLPPSLSPPPHSQVWAYKKTFPQRLPSLKLLSHLAPPSDPSATGDVKMEREYRVVENVVDGHGEGGGGRGDGGDGEEGGRGERGEGGGEELETVGLDELVRAYKYGPQVIPVSEYDRMANRFHAEKGIQIIGFTMRDQIPRHYFIKDTAILLPEPSNTKAALALSALAQAMEASKKVAIVRFKLTNRADSGVALGVLTPWCRGKRGFSEEDDEAVPDLLLLNTIPFSEDIREFSFPSLEAAPPNQQPTAVQSSAAAALVQAMSLVRCSTVGDDEEEYSKEEGMEEGEKLRPEDTPSPALQHYYDFIRARALQPKARIPPLPATLAAPLSHPLSADHPAAQSFAAAFPALRDHTVGPKQGDEHRPFRCNQCGALTDVVTVACYSVTNGPGAFRCNQCGALTDVQLSQADPSPDEPAPAAPGLDRPDSPGTKDQSKETSTAFRCNHQCGALTDVQLSQAEASPEEPAPATPASSRPDSPGAKDLSSEMSSGPSGVTSAGPPGVATVEK
ncbi:unnamed protein product, partial [Closterium sp. NIES-53]